MLKSSCKQFPSGSKKLSTITLEIRIIMQNIWRRVVDYILIKVSPSNIFLNMLLPARFQQSCQAAFGRSCEHYWDKERELTNNKLCQGGIIAGVNLLLDAQARQEASEFNSQAQCGLLWLAREGHAWPCYVISHCQGPSQKTKQTLTKNCMHTTETLRETTFVELA